ncbi:hypothetical protein CCH79_00003395 [Gambusia affinis]|uniref:Glucagon-like peptide 2 receptor n=1 Tax=Gambusia affinis TaxID=33528 RepID=A0A315VEE9_GAMAF|nr:hypothetical protein CCH79_00003395 [Gambusia affinis]
MPNLLAAQHNRIKLLLPLLLMVVSEQKATASLLESLISKRTEYWENCNSTLTSAPFPANGNYCKGSFDKFVCWPHSSPGNVSVPCPPFLPWITEDGNRRAYRECLENGSWRKMENSSDPWRDDSECKEDQYFKDKEEELLRHSALRLISVIGYSLSLFSLTLATLLMGMLRKLHCTRNYIHMNLFVSFILRAAAVISKEIIFHLMYSNLPKDDPGWNSYSSSAMVLLCKFSKVSMEYFVACNYFWLLVEAIFLHTLLFTAVLTKRCLLKKYVLLGWGTPVLFVTPWTMVKILYENTGLARATLVLIPLLGIHEVVFTVLIDECMEGSSRYARNFINLTLSSFQGFLVAVLYCFANGEVQTELKKRWQLFLFTNHFKVRTCFRGANLKHLWKCTRRQHRKRSRQFDSYGEGPTSTARPHLLQVAVQAGSRPLGLGPLKGQGIEGYDSAGLDFLTRKSLSSSDGEMTLGETMEEILEESQF